MNVEIPVNILSEKNENIIIWISLRCQLSYCVPGEEF